MGFFPVTSFSVQSNNLSRIWKFFNGRVNPKFQSREVQLADQPLSIRIMLNCDCGICIVVTQRIVVRNQPERKHELKIIPASILGPNNNRADKGISLSISTCPPRGKLPHQIWGRNPGKHQENKFLLISSLGFCSHKDLVSKY